MRNMLNPMPVLIPRWPHRHEDDDDRALGKQLYQLDADLAALPTGWPREAPPSDAYDGSNPGDVVALSTARKRR
jgi:hypothetical protein